MADCSIGGRLFKNSVYELQFITAKVYDLCREFFQEQDRVLFLDIMLIVDERERIFLRVDFPMPVVTNDAVKSFEFYSNKIVVETGNGIVNTCECFFAVAIDSSPKSPADHREKFSIKGKKRFIVAIGFLNAESIIDHPLIFRSCSHEVAFERQR